MWLMINFLPDLPAEGRRRCGIGDAPDGSGNACAAGSAAGSERTGILSDADQTQCGFRTACTGSGSSCGAGRVSGSQCPAFQSDTDPPQRGFTAVIRSGYSRLSGRARRTGRAAACGGARIQSDAAPQRQSAGACACRAVSG